MRRALLGALALVAACNAGQPGQGGQEPSLGAAAGAARTPDDPAAAAPPARAAEADALLSRAERLQSNLDAILAASSQVDGRWYVGDVTADFTMFFAGDRETYAEERVTLGDRGTAWRQYFFEAGELVFFIEEGTRAPSGATATAADSVVLILAFDVDGQVRSFYKTIGASPADLGESEVALVRQNLERLRAGARQAGP